MKFRTEVKPSPSSQVEITHHRPIVLLGSCFTHNIGNRLRSQLFNVEINPFGPLYNPCSISQAIDRIVSNTPFTQDELFLYNGMWHSFSHHSTFSSADPQTALLTINQRLKQAHETLAQASTLIITLGTAYIYTHATTGQVVANCHKLPATTFNRTRLSTSQSTQAITQAINRARELNPSLNIILTLSPIRHLADTHHGNQASKATLLLSIDDAIRQVAQPCEYFPAYEILLDDLRDYRFYASDLLHPSEQAIDYIYDIFRDTHMSLDTRQLADKCNSLTRRLDHKTISDSLNNPAVKEFTLQTQSIINQLLLSHPHLENALKAYQQ